MSASEQLCIRPARAEDRAAVVAMVATVWDGNDYIPQVWDDWLGDPHGPLLVGELAGQPVALAKLTRLADGEDWFEGLRVAPEQRGKGLARAMLRACVAQSRARGARSLRYITNGRNLTMHRLAAELGFALRYVPAFHTAAPLAGAPLPQALAAERLPALLADLERSPLLELTGGLYTFGWTSFELTEARLREHLGRGQVLALPGSAAWAVVEPAQRGGWWLAHIEGRPDALAPLCAALRGLPPPDDGPRDDTAVRAQLPPLPPLLAALDRSGYQAGEHGEHVYELRLR